MSAVVRDLLRASRRELEEVSRAGRYAALIGPGVLMVRVLDRLLLYCPADDCSVVPSLVSRGFWEPEVTLVVARTVRPGMRCLNVGAHLGYYAALMAHYAGPAGTVLAIEPQAAMHPLLRRTRMANLFATLELVQAAAGACDGEATLYCNQLLTGSATIIERPSWWQATPQESVPVVAVDDVVSGSIDFAVIDAEGSEPDVWAGMRKTIGISRDPIIVLEWAPSYLADPESFWDRLADDGFRASRIDPDGNIVPLTRAAALSSEHETLWVRRP